MTFQLTKFYVLIYRGMSVTQKNLQYMNSNLFWSRH